MFHSFDIEIAKKYGVNAAIIYQNFLFWICQNKANGRNYYDGRYWTYNSIKALSEILPYLTVDQIRRALDKLVDSGILIKGNYNKSSYDRTCWYSFVEEPLDLQAIEDTAKAEEKKDNSVNSTCEKGKIDSVKNTFPFGKNAEPIPDNKLDNKLESIASNVPNSPPSAFENFTQSFLDYYAKLTGSIITDLSQIPYFRNFRNRTELENIFKARLFNYIQCLKQSFEYAKTRPPEKRFFAFYDTLKVYLSSGNGDLIDKRTKELETLKKQIDFKQIEAEMIAEQQEIADLQGLSLDEYLKKSAEENDLILEKFRKLELKEA